MKTNATTSNCVTLMVLFPSPFRGEQRRAITMANADATCSASFAITRVIAILAAYIALNGGTHDRPAGNRRHRRDLRPIRCR
jgi:hypothetical protein